MHTRSALWGGRPVRELGRWRMDTRDAQVAFGPIPQHFGREHVLWRIQDMTDIETRLSKFASTAKAEEVKSSSWIARHPGWTLAIGIIEFLVIAWLSLRHL